MLQIRLHFRQLFFGFRQTPAFLVARPAAPDVFQIGSYVREEMVSPLLPAEPLLTVAIPVPTCAAALNANAAMIMPAVRTRFMDIPPGTIIADQNHIRLLRKRLPVPNRQTRERPASKPTKWPRQFPVSPSCSDHVSDMQSRFVPVGFKRSPGPNSEKDY